MTTVRQLLRNKGREVWSVPPDTTVFKALEHLAAHDCGALFVTENDRLIGIFSERDYARKVVLLGKTSKKTRVSELMTQRVICIEHDQSLDVAMSLLSKNRIRHLPVMDKGKLVGMITVGDVVGQIISDQEFTIKELETYITGGM